MVGRMGARSAIGAMGGIRGRVKALGGHITRDLVCHVAGAVAGFCVVLPFLIMLTDRRPVLAYENQRVVPDPVMRGAKAPLAFDVIEYRACEGTFQRVIIDSAGHVFSFDKEATSLRSVSSPPRPRTIYREFSVPRGAAVGPAIYRVHLTRWCNIVQKYVWPMRDMAHDVHFTIIDRPGAT